MAEGDRDTWEFYKDRSDEWRCPRTAPNGRVVGASSEGYKNRGDCVSNAKRHGYQGHSIAADSVAALGGPHNNRMASYASGFTTNV